ncbi:MAG: UDP-3-O-(3-hydroxymyristoyl)glucosamine N-acyltransferase [Candidatus Sericytochromatia bacterium]
MSYLFAFKLEELAETERYRDLSLKPLRLCQAATAGNPKDRAVIFAQRLLPELEQKLAGISNSLILLQQEQVLGNQAILQQNQVLFVENPRLEYAYIMTLILEKNRKPVSYRTMDPQIVIGANAVIGKNCRIEPFVLIEDRVVIGDHCLIQSGTRICDGVTIGQHTVIRQNSVIGGQGFGIERNERGETIRIPHVGGVVIGNYVEIGALNTVVSGTIEPTLIEDFVKTDDHVHIGHNGRIGRSTLIAACCETGGSTRIGAGSWLGPNSVLKENVVLAANSQVGISAVVTRSHAGTEFLVGIPAEPLSSFIRRREALDRLMQDQAGGQGEVPES